MSSQMAITFESVLGTRRPLNQSFDIGELYVCYHGGNRNGSFISKESIENAVESMYNCPVVCNYNVEEDEIGGHDVDIVNTDKGLRLINLTDAIGVIPESASYRWENVVEEDGTEHEYFVVDVILWKRSPAYSYINDKGYVSHSMEIEVRDGRTEDGWYVIRDFQFTAFCLLGENCEPCFESSNLRLFSLNLKNQLEDMIKEYSTDNNINQSQVDINQNITEGGELLDKKMELLAKFNMSVEDLNIDLEEISYEDLEAMLKEASTSEPDNGEPTVTVDEPDVIDFSLTAEQFLSELCTAISVETIETEWGTMRKYWYCDHDPAINEVYCYDYENWYLYGFTYSMDGDHVVIDFASKKRKKISIVDFDEGTNGVDFSMKNIFETVATQSADHRETEVTARFAEEKTILEEKYNTASSTIETLNTELEQLRSYQQTKMNEERHAGEDAVFAMFEELNGVEAFDNLRTNCADMTIEEIEEKCYAILGRQKGQKNKTFSADKPTPRLPIEPISAPANDEPYGGLFIKYPPRNAR